MLSEVIHPERSQPAMLLAEQLAHQRFARPGPLVLRPGLHRFPTHAADRDRTASRRSKRDSRTALMGARPNPCDRLQPQDATSRHRGAKPCRRYGLLGKISLLSPRYLLSVERPRFHKPWPGHYSQLSLLLDTSGSQSSSLVHLHSTPGCRPV